MLFKEMKRYEIAGLVLCFTCCCIIPAINFAVCKWDLNKFEPENQTCALIFGGVETFVCILGGLLLFGIIKF